MSHSRLYLVQESILLLVGAYLLLLGGTLNGLASYPLFTVTLCLVALISLAWLGWHVWRRAAVSAPPYWWALAALWAVYALSGWLGVDPRRSLNAFWLLSWAIWVYWLVHNVIRLGWPRELFVKALLLVGAIVIGFALLNLMMWQQRWFALAGWAEPMPPLWPRPTPFYSHANMVAAFVNLIWPMAAAWLVKSRSTAARVWCGVLILAAWVEVLFSSSRGGWLAAAGAFMVLAFGLAPSPSEWFARGKRLWRRMKWVVIAASAGLLAAGVLTGGLVIRLQSHPSHGGLIIDARTVYWQAAWQAFQQSPITGTGPDTYANAFLRRLSVPPNALFVRAHSMLMQLLAETGALGVSVAFVVMACVTWGLLSRWRTAHASPGGPDKTLIAGVAASLAGVAIHSLVDTPMATPATSICLMILLAVALTPVTEHLAAPARRWPALAGAALAMVVAGVGFWMQWGYAPYYRGIVLAAAGRDEEALPLLEEATRRDPGHAYYHIQTGFVAARLAGVQPELWPVAISHYRIALAIEPDYAVNYANLAVALQAAGHNREAAEIWQVAQLKAPDSPVFTLNLAVLQESLGATSEAQRLYRDVLERAPQWGDSAFWTTTPTRKGAWQAWNAQQPAVLPAETLDPEIQLTLADQAIKEGSSNPLAYLDKGWALLRLGRWAEAENALQRGLFCAEAGGNGVPVETTAEIVYALSLATYETGDHSAAINMLHQLLMADATQTYWGPGASGAEVYGWGIFYRVGLAQEALPGITFIRLSGSEVERWLRLGEWYEAEGNVQAAREIYELLLVESPGVAEAEARLSRLP